MDVNTLKKPLYFGALALLFLAFILVYFLGGRPSVLGAFKNGEYGEHVKMDSSFTYVTAKYNGGVAVFGKDAVFGISNSGQKTWKIPFTVSDPILSAAGRFVLAAEREGNRVLLISGGKVRREMEMSGAILTATVNAKGTFAVVMKERGFKALVKVYSASGKELFAWHSAEQNVLSVALSENTKSIAVSAVNMKDLSKISTILQFDLKDTVPQVLDVGDENLVSTVLYNRGELICVGDEAIYGFKKNGQQKFRIDYAGRELQKCSMYSGGILCAVFRGTDTAGGSVVEFYDARGIKKGSTSIAGNAASLDTFGKYAVVTAQNELYVINQSGRVVSKRVLDSASSRVLFLGSRNRFFMIRGSQAGMYVL